MAAEQFDEVEYQLLEMANHVFDVSVANLSLPDLQSYLTSRVQKDLCKELIEVEQQRASNFALIFKEWQHIGFNPSGRFPYDPVYFVQGLHLTLGLCKHSGTHITQISGCCTRRKDTDSHVYIPGGADDDNDEDAERIGHIITENNERHCSFVYKRLRVDRCDPKSVQDCPNPTSEEWGHKLKGECCQVLFHQAQKSSPRGSPFMKLSRSHIFDHGGRVSCSFADDHRCQYGRTKHE